MSQRSDQDSSSSAVPQVETAGSGGMASSVTRHAPFTDPESWEFLAAGVDSLDLGLHVEWGPLWDRFVDSMDKGKERAAGSKGILSADGQYLIHPRAKPPNYRWHLEFPEFHLFLGNSQEPKGKTPNVYASINSRALWELSVEGVIDRLVAVVGKLRGKVVGIKPSRVDLAADFRIPTDLSLELLREYRVPAHVQHWHIMSGDELETFYQGAKKSPIQLRIYAKGHEVAEKGTKLWLLEVWNTTSLAHVWRVEFQVRRQVLKQFGINSRENLREKLGGLWEYLTSEWFSLRYRDDSNTTRRTVHPFWLAVRECAEKFGPSLTLRRDFIGEPADVDWFVSHCAGCLVSYAARRGLTNLEEALDLFVVAIMEYWRKRSFAEELATRSIPLGEPRRPDEEGWDMQQAA